VAKIAARIRFPWDMMHARVHLCYDEEKQSKEGREKPGKYFAQIN